MDKNQHYLFASDFDQTLSFNDSGYVLSELIGASRFEEKVAGLARTNLVQQGGELAYLLRHDPEFRVVRREHLIKVGKLVRLKKRVDLLAKALESGVGEVQFQFFVISAAPREVIISALDGIVPADHIFGSEFDFDPVTGEIRSILRVPAGYGKVAVLEELSSRLNISPDRVVYVGDGNSDIHAMLHVNNGGGFTIAVSEARHITRIARRTVLSEAAPSVLVAMLEELFQWEPAQIRTLFASHGLSLQEWGKARTDWLTLRDFELEVPALAAGAE